MTYRIEFETAAERDLKSLPREMVNRIDLAIQRLAANPRPSGALKLRGYSSAVLRIRVGDYRIMYIVDDKQRLIRVMAIKPRPKAYR